MLKKSTEWAKFIRLANYNKCYFVLNELSIKHFVIYFYKNWKKK